MIIVILTIIVIVITVFIIFIFILIFIGSVFFLFGLGALAQQSASLPLSQKLRPAGYGRKTYGTETNLKLLIGSLSLPFLFFYS
jgi:hypothetical protein